MNNIKVTGIGGGTGLSTLFRGLRNEDIDISGIISVTDDGGSSGRLRAVSYTHLTLPTKRIV